MPEARTNGDMQEYFETEPHENVDKKAGILKRKEGNAERRVLFSEICLLSNYGNKAERQHNETQEPCKH